MFSNYNFPRQPNFQFQLFPGQARPQHLLDLILSDGVPGGLAEASHGKPLSWAAALPPGEGASREACRQEQAGFRQRCFKSNSISRVRGVQQHFKYFNHVISATVIVVVVCDAIHRLNL